MVFPNNHKIDKNENFITPTSRNFCDKIYWKKSDFIPHNDATIFKQTDLS